MQLTNNAQAWGIISRLFHWITAVLIIWAFYLGWTMTELEVSPEMFARYNFHKSLGLTVLALAILRLVWRLANNNPLLPEGMTGIEKTLAHITHWGLYAIILIMPFSGWLLTSAGGVPVNYFGLGSVPLLMDKNDGLAEIFERVHETLSNLLIVLFVLHVLGALKHHFINKDDTLRRMIMPSRS